MTLPAPTALATFDPAHPNFDALTLAPTAGDIHEFRRADAAAYRADPSNVHGAGAIDRYWAVLLAIAGAIVLFGVILGAAFVLAGRGNPGAQVVGVLFVVLVLLVGFTFALSLRQRMVGSRSEGASQLALSRFAANNGLVYRVRSPGPAYPGCLFTTNTRLPYVYNHFSTTTGRYIDFGNFHSQSVTGDGPGAHGTPDPLSSWGFLAVQIDRHLPNLVLESKLWRKKGVSLPIDPDPTQILSLEGDFDDYFTLYCPRQFEQEALSILTPDVMALLMDDAEPFDVEIVDNWMFFYSAKPFDSMDPAVYQRLFTILTTIAPKIVAQTSGYDGAALGPVAAVIPTGAPVVVDSVGQALALWAEPTSWHFVPAWQQSGPPGDRLKQRPPLGLVFAISVFVLLIAVYVVGMGITTLHSAANGTINLVL